MSRSLPVRTNEMTCSKNWSSAQLAHTARQCRQEGVGRRRENMVGVNMVLAEFIKFIHGLRVLF